MLLNLRYFADSIPSALTILSPYKPSIYANLRSFGTLSHLALSVVCFPNTGNCAQQFIMTSAIPHSNGDNLAAERLARSLYGFAQMLGGLLGRATMVRIGWLVSRPGDNVSSWHTSN
jgi:hypothetical protein